MTGSNVVFSDGYKPYSINSIEQFY